MPVISRFYGIAVAMYYKDHNPPHCHARYAGYEAIFNFDGEILEGELPPRAAGFMREWIIPHQPELSSNWEKARSGEPLDFIAPLE